MNSDFVTLDGTPLALSGPPPRSGDRVNIGQIENGAGATVVYLGPSFANWRHEDAHRFALRIRDSPITVRLQVASGDSKEVLDGWAGRAEWSSIYPDYRAIAAAGLWIVQAHLPARALLVLDGDGCLLYGDVPSTLDQEVDFDTALTHVEAIL